MVDTRPRAYEKARQRAAELKAQRDALQENNPVQAGKPPGTGFESERQRAKIALRDELDAFDGTGVHKIAANADRQQEERILNVAAYCRVSTDDIEQTISIEMQKKKLISESIMLSPINNSIVRFDHHQYTINLQHEEACNASSATNGSKLNKGDSVTAYEYSFDGTYVWYRIGSNRWVRGDFLAPAPGYSGEGDGDTGHTPMNMYEMYGSSTQVLRSGSRGRAVSNLQYTLLVTGDLEFAGNDGYDNCDGVFGTKTNIAVISFQNKFHLEADGIVGENTKAALWREVNRDENKYILGMCSSVI